MRMRWLMAVAAASLIANSLGSRGIAQDAASVGAPAVAPEDATAVEPTSILDEAPSFDFDPYRVLLWIVSDSPRVNADSLRMGVIDHLDRDFAAVWRTTVSDAPAPVATMAMRDLASMKFSVLAASDFVLAVKRSHEDIVRMQFASDVGRYVPDIYGAPGRINDFKARVRAQGDEGEQRFDWLSQLRPLAEDAGAVEEVWADPTIQAMLVTRGTAETLGDAKLKIESAKIIVPPLEGQVVDATADYDKIFIVNVHSMTTPMHVETIELDTLMQHFGSVASSMVDSLTLLDEVVALTVRDAFAPVVRIDNAGTKSAKGTVRGAGLILHEEHPALIKVGDVMQPMVRKNDRNENPISIGPLDWAYLYTTKKEGRRVEMDFYAGRPGGLQGRSNNRTFRVGLKVKPRGESTLLRLHAQGKVTDPLIGYEIYDKELDSTAMTFVGRTDWNGRLEIDPIERPLRLLYVKNGGAVLARLPLVPGHLPIAVADPAGDDMRLQAEAYILGVQNSIIDLVAVRELYKARILLRLKQGDLKGADELLEALRDQPSNEELANEMGKRQAMFLEAIGRNANQARKVDNMFSSTREMLSKHINPKLVQDLELAFIQAKKNGGKLPDTPES